MNFTIYLCTEKMYINWQKPEHFHACKYHVIYQSETLLELGQNWADLVYYVFVPWIPMTKKINDRNPLLLNYQH